MDADADADALAGARIKKRERAAMQETRALYRKADAAYAPFGCPASGECCQLATTQREPWLWRPEWLLLLERAGEIHGGLPPPRSDGGCPFLDAAGKRCTVYADRPLGCRTFFCHRITGPREQPRDLLNALSKRLEHVAQTLDDDRAPDARPLTAWYSAEQA